MFVHRLARLLYASFRPRLATIALALSLTLHLHQGWAEDLPSRPGELHPEALTDPYVNLSIHTARAIAQGLPPSIDHRIPPVAG